jgi:copper transport protein
MVIAVALALLFVAGSSWAANAAPLAHAIVKHSDPPNGSAPTQAPREIRLWFSEPVSPRLVQARVLNVDGVVVPSTEVRIDPSDPTLVVISPPLLPDGVYTVAFAVISAVDGHASQGHLVFKIGASGAGQDATPSEQFVPAAEVALRWLNFIALAGLVGAVAIAYLLLQPARVRDGGIEVVTVHLDRARRRVLEWASCCALVAFTIGLALLFWQASLLSLPVGGNPGADASGIGSMSLRLIGDTTFGRLWALRQCLLMVMVGLLFSWGRRTGQASRAASLMLGFLGIALLAIQARSGHAAAIEQNANLAVLVDTLHLMAASLWVGGLLALAIGVLPLVLAERGTPAFAALAQAGWRPFGGLAALSVGVLIATGLYSMGQQVASLDALLMTLYGRILITKVALVLMIGAIGLLNAAALHPRLSAPLARLRRLPADSTPLSLKYLPALVIVESAMGMIVLLATGALTSAAPPHGSEFVPQPAASALSFRSQEVDDLLITFQAEPNLPGQNITTMRVISLRRPPRAEILRVIARFSYLGQDLGMLSTTPKEVSPGVYQLTGEELSLAGPWQVDVVVRRKGIEDTTARFVSVVAAPSSARPVVISARPIGPPLTFAGAIVLAGVVLVAGASWLIGCGVRNRAEEARTWGHAGR